MIEIGAKKGYFISFEGTDGAGKGTQIDLLRQALQKMGFTVTLLREPGSTDVGEKLRDIVKDPKNKNITPEAELLIINAARAQLVTEKIKPALERGEVVICDRYYHSTVVYQGFGRGMNPHIVRAVTQFATQDVMPDVTFVVYLTEKEEKLRKASRGTTDRFEQENEAFQANVRKGYDWLIAQEGITNGKIVSINGNNSIENIHTEIYRCAAARISTLPNNALEVDQAKKLIHVTK